MIGQKLTETRRRLCITQQELSQRVPSSRESIAKYETGDRTFPDDLAGPYCVGLDDALFIKEVQNYYTSGVYIPYLNGPKILHEFASLIFLARRELKEAKTHLDEIDLTKPVEMMNESEIEHIQKTIYELLDAAASSETLVMDLCERFNFSYTQIVKQWVTSLEIRQMKKRRYSDE